MAKMPSWLSHGVWVLMFLAFLFLRQFGPEISEADQDRLLQTVSSTLASLGQVSSSTPIIPTIPTTTIDAEQGVRWPTAVSSTAVVTRVVDGDTVDVRFDETTDAVRIRLLGINTPESVDPRRPVQCFGKEASRALKALAEGKRIALQDDPQADDRDKYGRLLRTLVSEEGVDINATLVQQGFAHAYLSFPLSKTRKAQLRALQTEAQKAERGLWAATTCAGEP